MQEIRKMQAQQRILATAAMLCLGVIPAGACALFGQNSQNRDDARTNQDASAQDRDSRQDRSSANSPEASDTVTLPVVI